MLENSWQIPQLHCYFDLILFCFVHSYEIDKICLFLTNKSGNFIWFDLLFQDMVTVVPLHTEIVI